MPRAAMPKAAIYKHRDLLRTENEIRLTRQQCSAPPAGDAGGAEQTREPPLSARIAAAEDARHYRRALSRLENISHGEFAFAPLRPLR